MDDDDWKFRIFICFIGGFKMRYHMRNAIEMVCNLNTKVSVHLYMPKSIEPKPEFLSVLPNSILTDQVKIHLQNTKSDVGVGLEKINFTLSSFSAEQGNVIILFDLDNTTRIKNLPKEGKNKLSCPYFENLNSSK
jgi:hypothetical protein